MEKDGGYWWVGPGDVKAGGSLLDFRRHTPVVVLDRANPHTDACKSREICGPRSSSRCSELLLLLLLVARCRNARRGKGETREQALPRCGTPGSLMPPLHFFSLLFYRLSCQHLT